MKRTRKPTEPMHLVPCPGEAHSNAYIDNCGLCAPRWGQIEIPARFATLEAYREHIHQEREASGANRRDEAEGAEVRRILDRRAGR